MPRLARLDAPGVLHHVMGRGIERRKIFQSDTDRNDFIDRLEAKGLSVQSGRFGAMMEVGLVNDGPVTFVMDSRESK